MNEKRVEWLFKQWQIWGKIAVQERDGDKIRFTAASQIITILSHEIENESGLGFFEFMQKKSGGN
jgi:hypothetical protein